MGATARTVEERTAALVDAPAKEWRPDLVARATVLAAELVILLVIGVFLIAV